MQKKSAFPSARPRNRLLRRLACVLGAGLLAVSPSRAQLTQTIGYDPLVAGNLAGSYPDFSDFLFYLPFAFDFGGQYSLDSIQLLVFAGLDTPPLSNFSLFATPTLGTDLTLPPILTTFSATGSLTGTAAVYTFHADSSTLLTSGTTYYLGMSYPTGGNDINWVTVTSISGSLPAGGSNPVTSGNPSGGPSGGPSTGVTLTPLTALNTRSDLTFRQLPLDGSAYTDRSGGYGISITATAVPEPATFALVVVSLTLGAALFFRLRRRR